jgi:signal transduction histidine kinase/CheY-like chemotaxis protein
MLRRPAFSGPDATQFSQTVLYNVFVDSHQNIWFTSPTNGLYLIRSGSDVAHNYLHIAGENDSLTSNQSYQIFEDHSGFIWVTTDAGVSILDPNIIDVYSLKPSNIKGGQAVVDDKIGSTIEFHGKLLLGGAGAVYQFPLDPKGDGLKEPSNIFLRLDLRRDGSARALAEDNSGRLLVSTSSGDLLQVSPAGKVVRSWHPGSARDQRIQIINRIVTGDDSKVYLGTFGTGLISFDLDTGKVRFVDGLGPTELANNDIVEDVLKTGPHHLWAGTFRGVFQVDTTTGRSFLTPLLPGTAEPVIQSLYEDKQRNLWIGTYDGLWRVKLDASGASISAAESVGPFSQTQILAIEQDDQGRLWLATVDSLVRFDPKTDETLTFGKDQGSPISEYYSYGHTHTSDGWLWFSGGQGAVGLRPQDLGPNRHPPQVTINGVTAYREGKLSSKRLITGQPLTLTYQDSISMFDVAAMDFGAPQANRYSYRLVGFQPEWTPPTTSHLITFTNLNPGKYRLEVRAANNWDTWSTAPATLELIVLPPWWRTWWAYTIYLLIVIGSAIAYVYNLKRKILREKAISASLREANEIKSNFVEKLEFQVQEATLELRETLQGVNLKNAELEIAQRRATEGEQVKSQFLANMSHELRTPLTGVLGYTKLLTSTNLTSEQKDYVGTIRVSSEALLAIINDTLDLSRLEAGKLLIDEVDFDLLELVESTLELLAPIAYQRRLELIRVIPPDVPLSVRGDPLRLRQVLTNLLSNAIKFTESGSVCLEVKLLEHSERDAAVEFGVTDTGIGIPEGEIKQLFNAYARGRISTRHHVEGTGLGLAICKKLLDLMGGQVSVESRVGTGSTFRFQLRFKLQKHVAPRLQLPRKLSVLLYDKHPLSNQAWRASLTRLGAEVREVTELESLMALQAEAAVLSLSELELAHLGELKQKFSPSLPPMLILAPRIERQVLKDLSEALYHRVLSKSAREKTVYLELQSLVQHAIHPPAGNNDARTADTAPATNAPLVLVADDNRINRRLLVTMLKQAGFRTAEAGNGIELLDIASRGGWQAALLDIHMPGMDGIETATRLRVIYGEMTPPIIAMSADVLPTGSAAPQQGLMDDFLMKPFNEHQLVDLLRMHIERRQQRGHTAS